MKYQFGITEWGLTKDRGESVKKAARAGLTGLQLELGSYEDGFFLAQNKTMDAYLRDAQTFEIEFPCLSLNGLGTHGFLGHVCSREYKIAVESLKKGLWVASYMDIDTVVIPHFWANEIKNEEMLERAAEVLKIFCLAAGEKGIRVMSETTLHYKEQIGLMQRVDMPNYKTFYDSQNYKFFKGYSQLMMLEKLYPYMGEMLHVKGSTGQEKEGGVLGGALLGENDPEFGCGMDFLVQKKFSGWIILENIYHTPPLFKSEEDSLRLIQEDIARLKNALC